jgi:hypothetical protein
LTTLVGRLATDHLSLGTAWGFVLSTNLITCVQFLICLGFVGKYENVVI